MFESYHLNTFILYNSNTVSAHTEVDSFQKLFVSLKRLLTNIPLVKVLQLE